MTPEGLELGARGRHRRDVRRAGRDRLRRCLALVDNAPTATSAYYVYEDEVWGFGLWSAGARPASKRLASCGQREQGRERVVALGEPALAVDEVRACRARRALDVVERGVPDHRRQRRPPRSSSAARKIVGLGFTFPCTPEEIHASTSSAKWFTKAVRSRLVFETKPIGS